MYGDKTLAELEQKANTINYIITNMNYENKYMNSINSKKEELNTIMAQSTHKLKKAIENQLQRNNELETELQKKADEKPWLQQLQAIIDEEERLRQTFKAMQKEDQEVLYKANEVMDNHETLKEQELNDLLEGEQQIGKLNQTRWITNKDGKTYGYLSLPDKRVAKIDVDDNLDSKALKKNVWEQIEKAYLSYLQ